MKKLEVGRPESEVTADKKIMATMYPKNLTPSGIEKFDISSHTIEIPKCVLTFDRWTGQPIKETFGGKPIVSIDNKPMFAELAIMTYFLSDGWEARWVETYGRSGKEPIYLTEWKDDKYKNQTHRPILNTDIKKLLAEIAKHNSDSYSGCWDIFGWKDGRILFAESKRNKRDRIRHTQNNWLTAGLKYGLSPLNFLVVQWDIN